MINPKAYTEVYEIIKHMPKYMKEKIPKNLIQSIEENMDKNYKVDVEDLEECELLEDTEKLLSVIYTDYLATEEEYQAIKAKERAYRWEREKALKEKQKDVEIKFKNKN